MKKTQHESPPLGSRHDKATGYCRISAPMFAFQVFNRFSLDFFDFQEISG